MAGVGAMPGDLRGALEMLARDGLDARVRIRGLTTAQVRLGTEVSLALSEGAIGAPVALTVRVAGGMARLLMVGKDGLDDETVLLG